MVMRSISLKYNCIIEQKDNCLCGSVKYYIFTKQNKLNCITQ